jgi:hypothetical protein
LAQSFWRRGGDSNLRGLEASRPSEPGRFRFKAAHGSRGGSLASPCNFANARSSLSLSGRATSCPALRIPSCFYCLLVDSLAQSFWRRGGDSNLRGLEASRPSESGRFRFKAVHGSRGGSLASPCNSANARSSLAFSMQGYCVSRPSNPLTVPGFFPLTRWLVASLAQSFWRRGGDSNLPSFPTRRSSDLEPTFPRSLAPRGRCVSREARSPSQARARSRAWRRASRTRRPTDGRVAPFLGRPTPSCDARRPRPEGRGWPGARLCQLAHPMAPHRPSLSSSPFIPASLRRGHALAWDGLRGSRGGSPSGFSTARRQAVGGIALKTTDAPPPFESPDCSWILSVDSLARCLVGSILLAERGGFERKGLGGLARVRVRSLRRTRALAFPARASPQRPRLQTLALRARFRTWP